MKKYFPHTLIFTSDGDDIFVFQESKIFKSNLCFGFERNMFDRIGHFAVGFYALPIMEYVYSRGIIKSKLVTVLYGIFAIAFVAACYEWIEWIYAVKYGGEAGAAFLGF